MLSVVLQRRPDLINDRSTKLRGGRHDTRPAGVDLGREGNGFAVHVENNATGPFNDHRRRRKINKTMGSAASVDKCVKNTVTNKGGLNRR